MEIYNISEPSNPILEDSYWHATSCDPVYPVDENTAYLTLRTGEFNECPGDESELLVLDVSGDWTTEVQNIEMESPYGLTLIGDRLFVGEGANGLKVFNATNRRSLSLEKWDRKIAAYDVIAHPTRTDLILVAGPDGFSQYRVTSGNIQYGSHGRPMCRPGNTAAQITAKMVIASAKRLIAVRQFCRNKNKIALISVPAWPMPTQNTKLTIGNPHATGIMLPQAPIPVQNTHATLMPNTPSKLSANANAMYQARGGLGVSAMRETLSVIRANVLSPAGGASKGLTSLRIAMG
jgi:hypothetical protein